MKSIIWVISEIILVFVLLSMPGSEFSDPTSWIAMIMSLPFADKMIHVALFGSLAFSIFLHFELSLQPSFKTIRAKALALLFCVLYGIGMEYYQKYYVPSRGFEVKDMLADAIGALLALPLFNSIKYKLIK
ncbi:MAG: VanZ family protein [Bacteroidetes bacterium]|jgi:VanZ family protein|nr:VanZ family protein [Bacteroidota bacterium]